MKKVQVDFNGHVQTGDELGNLMAELEETGRWTYVSTHRRCLTFGVRCVPSGALDVIVDERLLRLLECSNDIQLVTPKDGRNRILLQVVQKPGKYSGRVRRRLAIRLASSETIRALDSKYVAFACQRLAGSHVTMSMSMQSGAEWFETFPLTTGLFELTRAGRLVNWHFARYYPNLHRDDPLLADVRALADGPVEMWLTHPRTGLPYEQEVSVTTANRAAGRALYRIFRNAGWRLLTNRERTSLGLHEHGGHWVPADVYEAAQQRKHGLTVGEATLRAARTPGGTFDPDVEMISRKAHQRT